MNSVVKAYTSRGPRGIAQISRRSDIDLLAGFAAADASAASAFVARFGPAVDAVARAVVHDPLMAEDVAQLTFERAFRQAGQYDADRGSVATWLGSIARHAALDQNRRHRRRPTAPLDEIVTSARSHQPDPADTVARHDAVRRAAVAVDRLPDPQRRAVTLAVYGDRTAAEIAAHEKIPLGTAKTRVRTGLSRVRTAMAAFVLALVGLAGIIA
jgi:RNA polymerase sigma-70 factor (ECF subfamily)